MKSAGRLRHRIDIARSVEADDDLGGSTLSLEAVATGVRAEVIGLPGRETILGQALQTICFYEVTIRYRPGVVGRTALQLRYGDLDLNVRSAIDPDGRRRELVILADTAGTLPVTT